MTNLINIPTLEAIFQTSDKADVILPVVVTLIGETLECDRCFLYLRDPATRMGKVPFCWRRHDHIPEVWDADWKLEPPSLSTEDPMFAAALQTAPSIYVDDVEVASPNVLNRQLEQEHFGHRALIHAHLCQDGQLWGVLQPSVFGHPRQWTSRDRQRMTSVEQAIVPFAIAYIQTETRHLQGN